MKSCFITFRSVTLAQRGEGTLQRAGIHCVLQRTPRWMEERGCGYCLRVRQQDALACAQLLRENEILFRKVYLILESGKAEEVEV